MQRSGEVSPVVTRPRDARRTPVWRRLWLQVLVGMAAGVLVGWLYPQLGAALKPLGDMFIALVRMLIAPIIFCTVVSGVAGMSDMRRVGRVALKALVYFEIMTSVALFFAMAFVNLLRPGAGMHLDLARLGGAEVAGYVAQAKTTGLLDTLVHIIPTTFPGAFTQPDVLQTLFASVLFAFGLSAAGPAGEPVLGMVKSLSKVFFNVVHFIMYAAPIGSFGAMAFTVGKFGAASLLSLGALIGEFFAVSLLFTIVVLGAAARWAGVSIFRLMFYIRDELMVVAATTSSESVLPALIEKLRGLGCEDSVVGLVIPTGYSFNLDGTCLYLTTAALFLAQATDTPLTLGQQFGLIGVLLLTSKGAAGVAGAALVVLAATLGSSGEIPVASIGLILGVHRILAEALTFVNVVGNCVATIVVAKWEGALDQDRLRAALEPGADAA
jgi:aerobic C4-dicarboxylate transport protein